MIRPGAPWGGPASGDGGATVEVRGGDADLAAAAVAVPDEAVVHFVPTSDSDFARTLGLGPAGGPGRATVACDLLDLGQGLVAVNAVVLGVPPDRLGAHHRFQPVLVEVDGRAAFRGPATTVVVAGGQFLRGADLVPRGHPGDGRAEIQVYALHRRERRSMRDRLGGGDHVPHPRITQYSGRRVSVRWEHRAARLEADGQVLEPTAAIEIGVRPGALRVLI